MAESKACETTAVTDCRASLALLVQQIRQMDGSGAATTKTEDVTRWMRAYDYEGERDRMDKVVKGASGGTATSTYTRHLLATDDRTFSLMLLRWPRGSASAIHDHCGSECWMRVLRGRLRETRYQQCVVRRGSGSDDRKNNGACFEEDAVSVPVRVDGEDVVWRAGDVAHINDRIGLHRVSYEGGAEGGAEENKEQQKSSDCALSLHLYRPPYQSCRSFVASGSADACGK